MFAENNGQFEGMIECPCCMCIFASEYDLDFHLKEYGSNKWEHLQLLDRAHKSIDKSCARGLLAKGSKIRPKRDRSRFYL